MIHCLTSSYKRDFIRATALNKKLLKNNVVHHLFVEAADVQQFKQLENINTFIHVKPDGGEGGLGRSGTMVRFPCYLKIQEFLSEGDTYVQLDSDVILVDDEIIIEALKCSENEIKGFYHSGHPVHLERTSTIPPTDIRFWAVSGMTICAGAGVFKKSIPNSEQEILSIIELLLNEGFTPSEDVVLSYLLQRGDFKLTNLNDTFWRVFHPNGDIEVLNRLDKGRFEGMFNYNFLKDNITKAEMEDFIKSSLFDPKAVVL